MCNEEKNYTSAKEEAADGTFFKLNSNKYFLKIKQCLEIDKVVFVFVENGTQGKSKVEAYINAEEFDFLCDMILDGTLKKDILNDNGKYPSAWVRQVGDGGSKIVAIGKGSSMPIVIKGQQSIDGNNKFILLGVDRYERLERMARKWKKISEDYFDEIMMTIKKATHNYSKEEAEKNKKPKTITMQVTAKASCNERQSKKGDFAMACCEGTDVKTGKAVNVVIPAEAVSKMSVESWKKFLERSNDRKTPLTFKGEFVETLENEKPVYVFQNFVK